MSELVWLFCSAKFRPFLSSCSDVPLLLPWSIWSKTAHRYVCPAREKRKKGREHPLKGIIQKMLTSHGPELYHMATTWLLGAAVSFTLVSASYYLDISYYDKKKKRPGLERRNILDCAIPFTAYHFLNTLR